jgi:hypothetical protein
MPGERNLAALLQSMTARDARRRHSFFAAFRKTRKIPATLRPVHIFREREGTALIVRREEAESAELPYQFASRLITLTVHSSLEAIGFLAAITGRLAEAGISVNAVSAFYHDPFVRAGAQSRGKRCVNLHRHGRSTCSCRRPDDRRRHPG